MHQCQTCQKWFPRPSGLATHMNTHSGAKPYTCPVPGCCRRFGVRSNAKRHLRTHGIIATADMSFLSSAEDTDSETAPEHEGWVPQSLRKRCLKLEDPDSCPILIPELSPVRPISYSREGVMLYEERDSFAKAPIAPYHPDCWARLPGPAPKPAPTYIYQTPSCLWEVAGGSFT
ncbi:hypothetical protein BC834DRAFT_132402 [Gloeopeniophorella convolvens]|nr:hypothetical protein BC834DRAFT_132402 [Gloeopeniophorella convolvens]